MATKVVGGGSSAVAASSHAACPRFRGTDPLITGKTRRNLANAVGFSDEFGGIPDARWMRAMTFERLVRDQRFASQVATTTVGRLGLARPTSVVIANAKVNVDRTAALLADAHARALSDGAATILHGLAIPFVGFEDERATDVKPDFAVVAPATDSVGGSWLIVGDAKDYERVRSRIDDHRLLKGFLQVGLGAESAEHWSKLPSGMRVHTHGVLAVPRNSFLQPQALIEDLHDHRAEVRMRVAERRSEAAAIDYDEDSPIVDHVRALLAEFDPGSCSSCTLFSFCRHELRTSGVPTDLLIEIGIDPADRPHVIGIVDGTGVVGEPRASARAQVLASVTGVAQSTGQRRVDPIGQAGTINVVIAKSDAAALGVYGISTRRIGDNDAGEWRTTTFSDPQSPETRRAIMQLLGVEIVAAMKDRRKANPAEPEPIHLVVPDQATADLLASMADNLAGIELSRLRWARDKEMGRPTLTFDGGPAQIPKRLTDKERTAVSFLLEEDRARAFTLRSPIIDARSVLARHMVAGGPAASALRLDYLTAWAAADPTAGPERHRAISDAIEADVRTPGARLTNRRSNEIHLAYTGSRSDDARPADPALYATLIQDELAYKSAVLDAAITALAAFPPSSLQAVYRTVEGDAQAVWRRRLSLHASDLVRFGRTYRWWRNTLVTAIEADGKCAQQLLSVTNPHAALDAAADAGTRELAVATVVSTDPLILRIDSRRIGQTHHERIVLLHVNDSACADSFGLSVDYLKGSFKLAGLSIGPVDVVDPQRRHFRWHPERDPGLTVGDQLVLADLAWFNPGRSNKVFSIGRPQPDAVGAPKVDCTADSYAADPEAHQYCCRPHEVSEAEWSDELAARRERGELNPQAWPPVVDADAFDVSPGDAPTGDPSATPAVAAPDDVTADDLD